MSGSMEVNAKLAAWGALTNKRLEAAMDQHIKNSAAYAQSNGRWNDLTGASRGSIRGDTETTALAIKSSVSGGVKTNVYLELAWFFDGKYRILEEARSNNIGILWVKIASILQGGSTGWI